MENRTFVQELCVILVNMGVIKASEGESMQSAFKDSSKAAFDEFLLGEGLVAEKDLFKALSEYYQVPFMDVDGIFFDSALLHKFPKGMLLRLGVIPHEVDGNILMLVATRPNDSNLLSCLGKYVSYDLQFMVGLRRHIENNIKEFYEKSVTQVDEGEDRELINIENYGTYQNEELLEDEEGAEAVDLTEEDDEFDSEC